MKSKTIYKGPRFGEYATAHNLDCELIIAGAEMPASFVWNKGDTLTNYGKEFFKGIWDAPFEVLENGTIVVLSDEDEQTLRRAGFFVLASAGYSASRVYNRLFVTKTGVTP